MAEVTACMTCESRALTRILDLGDQPLAERDDGRRYPLALLECQACQLVQLSYAVDRAEVFPEDHPYATGNTRAMREHFGELAAAVAPLLGDGDLIADIGANDGTFLAAVKRMAPRARVLAVEPTGQVAACRARGVPAEQEFFTHELAGEIVRWMGPVTVITAANVLAHAGDQHDFLAGVARLLAPGGTFITENHDWSSVVNGLQVDTVYHEHLRYYSPASLGALLSRHGFLIDRLEKISTHGGSFRTWAVRQRRDLQDRADAARGQLCRLLEDVSEDGEIWGVGAATRATPLIHYAGLDRWIRKIAEVPGSAKIGMTMPGTKITVEDEREMLLAAPPHALLFCWHVAAGVVPKLRAAGYEGKFIVPLPEAGIYRG